MKNIVKIIKKTDENKNNEIVFQIKVGFDLYRFRALSKRNIKAFKNDELWLSSPLTFNDPYDISLSYTNKILKEYCKQGGIILETEIGLPRKNMEAYLYYALIRLFPEYLKLAKDNYYIACFSSFITEEIMWAHYADNGKGFVLGYNEKKLRSLKTDINPIGLFPVYYTNKKPLSDDLVFNIVNSLIHGLRVKYGKTDVVNENPYENLNEDEIDEINQTYLQSLIYKKKAWQYENEFRLILRKEIDSEKHQCIKNVRPDAIYLGEFMPEEEKKKLIEIAFKKNVNVYFMVSDFSKDTNQLRIKGIIRNNSKDAKIH